MWHFSEEQVASILKRSLQKWKLAILFIYSRFSSLTQGLAVCAPRQLSPPSTVHSVLLLQSHMAHIFLDKVSPHYLHDRRSKINSQFPFLCNRPWTQSLKFSLKKVSELLTRENFFFYSSVFEKYFTFLKKKSYFLCRRLNSVYIEARIYLSISIFRLGA